MKKHGIFIGILLLVSVSLAGQETNEPPDSKLRIGVSFSPNYSYRVLKSDAGSNFVPDMRNEQEIPKFGYSAGLSVVYTLNQNISLESGVLFTDRGEKTNELDFSGIDTIYNYPKNGKISYHYQYLDIPVKINIILLRNNFSIFFSGGVSANFLLNEFHRVKGEKNDGSEFEEKTDDDRLEPFNLQLLIGAGVDYNLTENFSIRFEPVFRRSVISIVDATLRQYPYSFGANFAAYYRFPNRQK